MVAMKVVRRQRKSKRLDWLNQPLPVREIPLHAMATPQAASAVSTVRNIQKKRWFLSPMQLASHGQ